MEKDILKDMEFLFQQDIRRQIKNISNKKSRQRNKFKKAVDSNNQTKQVEAQQGMYYLERERERLYAEIGVDRESKEQRRANALIRDLNAGKISLQIGYMYYQRKEAVEFITRSLKPVFSEEKNLIIDWRKASITIKTFLGYSVKTETEKILSWIDSHFEDLDSTNAIVFQIERDAITDYWIVDASDYKNVGKKKK